MVSEKKSGGGSSSLVNVSIHRTLARSIQAKVLQNRSTKSANPHIQQRTAKRQDADNRGREKSEQAADRERVRWRRTKKGTQSDDPGVGTHLVVKNVAIDQMDVVQLRQSNLAGCAHKVRSGRPCVLIADRDDDDVWEMDKVCMNEVSKVTAQVMGGHRPALAPKMSDAAASIDPMRCEGAPYDMSALDSLRRNLRRVLISTVSLARRIYATTTVPSMFSTISAFFLERFKTIVENACTPASPASATETAAEATGLRGVTNVESLRGSKDGRRRDVGRSLLACG